MAIIVDRTPSGADWRHRAACTDEDPELFFPDGERAPEVLEQIEEAKLVCSLCPVVLQCRTWALDSRQAFGVWGGLSEQERQGIWGHRGRRDRAVA